MIDESYIEAIKQSARKELIMQITQEFKDAMEDNIEPLPQIEAYEIFREHCTDLEERLINNK